MLHMGDTIRVPVLAVVDDLDDGLHGFHCGCGLRVDLAADFFKSEVGEGQDVAGDLFGYAGHGLLHSKALNLPALSVEALGDNGEQVEGSSQGGRIAVLGLTRLFQ